MCLPRFMVIGDSCHQNRIDIHIMRQTIIGSSQKFSEETLNILSKNPFNITIRYGDNQYRNVTSTVFASIIQVYSAFCNLIQNLYVSVASSNFYNFLYNSFNNVGVALNIQLTLFIAENALKWAEMIIIIIIISVAYFLLNLIMYIIICRGFVQNLSQRLQDQSKTSNNKAYYTYLKCL